MTGDVRGEWGTTLGGTSWAPVLRMSRRFNVHQHPPKGAPLLTQGHHQ